MQPICDFLGMQRLSHRWLDEEQISQILQNLAQKLEDSISLEPNGFEVGYQM